MLLTVFKTRTGKTAIDVSAPCRGVTGAKRGLHLEVADAVCSEIGGVDNTIAGAFENVRALDLLAECGWAGDGGTNTGCDEDRSDDDNREDAAQYDDQCPTCFGWCDVVHSLFLFFDDFSDYVFKAA